MTDDLGWVDLGVKPDTTGFGPSLDRQIGNEVVTVGRSAGSRFSAGFKRAAALGAAGAVTASLLAIRLGKESVAEASNLNESINAVNVSYGRQSAAVQRLGREASTSLGLSNTEFNSLSVRFSAFAENIAGGKGRKVVSTLDDLTTRAADFASVMNLDVADAANIFQSGLAGESEPLRQYGIDLSAAAVEAHALAKGLVEPTKNVLEIRKAQLDASDAQRAYTESVKEHGESSSEAQRAALELKDAELQLKDATKGSVGEMTEAEKVQARYSLLMEQTNKTAGDFANTSDSLANRQRILSASVDDIQARLGTALLPVLEDTTGFILDHGIPALEDFSDWFGKTGAPAIADFRDDVAPLVRDLLPAMGDALGTARDVLADAVPYARDLVGWFNDLPDGVKNGLLIGGGLYAGGKILGGGNGGGSGMPSLGPAGILGATKGAVVTKSGELLADKLLAKFQKPLPVVVTNPGFGRGGGGPGAGAAVVPDSDSKRTDGSSTDSDRRNRFAGRGNTFGGVLGSLSLPWILGEAGAELDYLTTESPFAPRPDRPSGDVGFTASVDDAMAGFDTSGIGQSFQGIPLAAEEALAETARAFAEADIPTDLKTNIAMMGVPEAMSDARALVRQYDLTPKEKRTLFQLLGYEQVINQARTVNRELDYAARDRRTQITVDFANRGYETAGGLQSGAADTYSAERNFDAARGRMGN